MKIRNLLIASAVSLIGLAPAAQAETIVVEANYARAQGDWGAELGGGMSLEGGGFALRPMAGAFIRDGDTSLYAKAEATYTFPMFAEVGAGARFSGDKTRIYGTASVPLLPMLRLKGNIGDRYYAIGLRAGF